MRHPFPSAACRALLCLSLLPASAFALDFHAAVSVAGELDGRGPHSTGETVDAEDAPGLLVGATNEWGFGVEAAYVDLGRLRASGIADGGFDTEGGLWSVSATWAWRLDRVEPFVRAGWFSREEDGVAITIAGPTPLSLDDDGLTGELGLRWRVSDPVALRLGYVWYDFEPEDDSSLQLGVEWHFGK